MCADVPVYVRHLGQHVSWSQAHKMGKGRKETEGWDSITEHWMEIQHPVTLFTHPKCLVSIPTPYFPDGMCCLMWVVSNRRSTGCRMGPSYLHVGMLCWGCQSLGLCHCVCTLLAGETYPWNCDLPLTCSKVLLWLLPVFMLQTGKGWCQLLVAVFAIKRPKKMMYRLEDVTVLCHLSISKDRWQFCSVSFAYFCVV